MTDGAVRPGPQRGDEQVAVGVARVGHQAVDAMRDPLEHAAPDEMGQDLVADGRLESLGGGEVPAVALGHVEQPERHRCVHPLIPIRSGNETELASLDLVFLAFGGLGSDGVPISRFMATMRPDRMGAMGSG